MPKTLKNTAWISMASGTKTNNLICAVGDVTPMRIVYATHRASARWVFFNVKTLQNPKVFSILVSSKTITKKQNQPMLKRCRNQNVFLY